MDHNPLPVVGAEQLATIWPQVAPWIARAVEQNQGDENLLDVLVALARGQYVLVAAEKYAAVLQVTKFPRQTVCTVLYCGGSDLPAMKQAFEAGCEWAKMNGISVVRIYGRKGWQRALGAYSSGVCLQRRLVA